MSRKGGDILPPLRRVTTLLANKGVRKLLVIGRLAEPYKFPHIIPGEYYKHSELCETHFRTFSLPDQCVTPI